MPTRIPEYDLTIPQITLNPNDRGYTAWETVGRRIAPVFNQIADDQRKGGALGRDLFNMQADLAKTAGTLQAQSYEMAVGALKFAALASQNEDINTAAEEAAARPAASSGSPERMPGLRIHDSGAGIDRGYSTRSYPGGDYRAFNEASGGGVGASALAYDLNSAASYGGSRSRGSRYVDNNTYPPGYLASSYDRGKYRGPNDDAAKAADAYFNNLQGYYDRYTGGTGGIPTGGPSDYNVSEGGGPDPNRDYGGGYGAQSSSGWFSGFTGAIANGARLLGNDIVSGIGLSGGDYADVDMSASQ